MNRLGDAVRLSVGTFSAVPVPPPRQVDRATAGVAVAIAPLAVLPVGALVAATVWAGRELALPAVVIGALAIGAGAWATRGFHLDGLADTTDALASSHDRARALAVARTGDVGPAGAVALVLVLLMQIASAGALASWSWGPVAVGALWCLARTAATVPLRRGVPPARQDGMGATFAGTVPLGVAAGAWLVTTAVVVVVLAEWFDQTALAGVATVLVTLAVVVAFVRHVARRLGGIIGDLVGASVEIALAALLVGFAAVVA